MTTEQKTKQTIHNTARKIAKEISANFDMEFDSDALDIIAELTYKKLQLYGTDLDAFQKHAKRSTITADDVKLLVRRNESLKELVDSRLQAIIARNPHEPTNNQKRKRKGTV
nr:centromere protein S-like [Leptinotarsa decemlineata]